MAEAKVVDVEFDGKASDPRVKRFTPPVRFDFSTTLQSPFFWMLVGGVIVAVLLTRTRGPRLSFDR